MVTTPSVGGPKIVGVRLTISVPVPSRRVRAVDSYHIDGTVGVINL